MPLTKFMSSSSKTGKRDPINFCPYARIHPSYGRPWCCMYSQGPCETRFPHHMYQVPNKWCIIHDDLSPYQSMLDMIHLHLQVIPLYTLIPWWSWIMVCSRSDTNGCVEATHHLFLTAWMTLLLNNRICWIHYHHVLHTIQIYQKLFG